MGVDGMRGLGHRRGAPVGQFVAGWEGGMREARVGGLLLALVVASCRGESGSGEGEGDAATRAVATEATGAGSGEPAPANEEEPEVGFVTVTSSEPAAVYVDGIDIGQRTPARRIPVAPGRHQIQVRFDGTEALTAPDAVSVRVGLSTSVYFERPAPATGTGDGTGAGTGAGTGDGTGSH